MKNHRTLTIVLLICYLIAWIDRMAITLALPQISTHFDLNPTSQGLLLSAFFAGYALMQIPGGHWADKYGPRLVILGALMWWSCFTILTAIVPDYKTLLVIRFLFGIGEGVFPAAVWKLLAAEYPERRRATVNAWILSSVALGPAITPLISVPILESWGWRPLFVTIGISGLAAVMLASLTLPRNQNSQNVGKESTRRSITLDKRTKYNMIVLFLVCFMANIAFYGWLNWLPSYFVKVKGLSLSKTAWTVSAPFFAGAIGCALAGMISDRFFVGRRRYLASACTILGAGFLYIFTQSQSAGAYMFFQCVAAFLLFMGAGAIWALPVNILPTSVMGLGTGFINMGGQLGGVTSGLVIGWWITASNGQYAAGFQVMLVAFAAAALLAFLGVREQSDKTPRWSEASLSTV